MYYRMMPDPWKRSFLNSGQMLTDPNYTLLDLQCYMSLQEDQQQMMQPRRSSGRAPIVARGGLRAPTSTRRRHYPDYQGGPPTQRYRHARNDHAQQYYNYRNQPPQPQQQGPAVPSSVSWILELQVVGFLVQDFRNTSKAKPWLNLPAKPWQVLSLQTKKFNLNESCFQSFLRQENLTMLKPRSSLHSVNMT